MGWAPSPARSHAAFTPGLVAAHGHDLRSFAHAALDDGGAGAGAAAGDDDDLVLELHSTTSSPKIWVRFMMRR